MDIEKNKLKIGKVRVDIYPKQQDGKKTKAQIVTLRPEPNQSNDSRDVAKNFLQNVFKDKSKYGRGLISFKLNDTEGWKNKYGNKFIRAIRNSGINISWTGDPKAIKGLKSLLPKGIQQSLMQGIGGPGSLLDRPQPGMNLGQIGQPGGIPGLGGLEIGPNVVSGAPQAELTPAPQVASYIHDMKNLIKLWEDADHEV